MRTGTSLQILASSHKPAFFVLKTNFKNLNRDELVLNDGDRSQFGMRSDVSLQLPHSNRLEAGLYVRSQNVNSFSQRFGFANVGFDFGSFDQSGTEQAVLRSGYLEE
jgi:hypothetical protein